MAERKEVSAQEIRFFLAAHARRDYWTTAKQFAEHAQLAGRTARAYAKKFRELGLFDQAAVHPEYYYRLSDLAADRNAAYLDKLHEAAAIIDLSRLESLTR